MLFSTTAALDMMLKHWNEMFDGDWLLNCCRYNSGTLYGGNEAMKARGKRRDLVAFVYRETNYNKMLMSEISKTANAGYAPSAINGDESACCWHECLEQ